MKRIFIVILSVLLLAGCAKISTPVGGPKDTEPPVVIKEVPASQSVNFNSQKIAVTMNEFFTLNNPTENVMVSPPFKNQPEYLTKGKTLIIKIKDTLRENTTYNLVFSNCIQDFTENNKLNLYHYSFSTGKVIDSCMLRGSLSNAKSMEKSEDFLVMLYRQDIDSLPMTTMPDYVTKSAKDGSFTFQNIAPGSYKIFALKDINSNYLYDLPNESVAYAGQLFDAYPAPRKDSTGRIIDTAFVPQDIVLYTFEAADSCPKLMRYENPEAGVYKFPYTKAVTAFEAQTFTGSNEYFQSWNTTHDTVTWFFKSLNFDSLSYLLTADGHTDTVFLKPYKAKSSSGGRGGSSAQQTAKKLRVTFQNEGDYYKPLKLKFSYPILPTDTFDALLTSKTDTSVVRIAVPDTFLTELTVPLKMEAKKSYQLIIPDSVFFGHNGLTNDTLKSSFTCKSEKDYGNIIMAYSLSDEIDYPVIAQLWSDKAMVAESAFRADTTIIYEHLDPGAYQVKIIHDLNGNGHWDTGDYRRKMQPEAITTYPSAINVRAYWDVEEEFKIDKSK